MENKERQPPNGQGESEDRMSRWGRATYFGGPSLEWQAFWGEGKKIRGVEDRGIREGRLSVNWLYSLEHYAMANVIEMLPDDIYSKNHRTFAAATRIVIPLGHEYVLKPMVASEAPNLVLKSKRKYHETPLEDLKHPGVSLNFRINGLGDAYIDPNRKENNMSLRVRNEGIASEITTMARRLRLPNQTYTHLCITAGLAQSVDLEWVRKDMKKEFIRVVDKDFRKWLRENFR